MNYSIEKKASAFSFYGSMTKVAVQIKIAQANEDVTFKLVTE